jgi:hypothetical protein
MVIIGRRTQDPRETDGLSTVPYHYAYATFLSRLPKPVWKREAWW